MDMSTPLTPEAVRVLRIVNRQMTDGYSLLQQANLTPPDLVKALDELTLRSLVVIKGDLNPNSIGSAFVYVPPSSRGSASIAASGFNPSSYGEIAP